jgi:phosphohistidine phosphatase
MPQLLIMRHAKSDWTSDSGSDHGRTLAPRGVKAAKKIGRLLARDGRAPDLVLTSTAVRALKTVELAAEEGNWSCPVEQLEGLYGIEPPAVVTLLAARDLPERVMVVGHEPCWSALVALLIGGGRVRMPTAAVACLEFDGDWTALAPGRCRLLWLIVPKLVKCVF